MFDKVGFSLTRAYIMETVNLQFRTYHDRNGEFTV